MFKGSCLCGKITFQVDAFADKIANCYCQQCRKFSGAAYSTFAAVKLNKLTWLSGESNLKIYHSSEQACRGFCSNCGASIYYQLKDTEGLIAIALGTLDDEQSQQMPLNIDANIYCSSKAKWIKEPANTLKNYAKGRED